MSSVPITLFDLPSTAPCKGWSANTLKTRLYLNFKGLDYKTEWVEYPDIESKFKALGVPPNEKGVAVADYTVPVVYLKDSDEYIMESMKIAKRLESQHPSPSVHLDDPLLQKVMPLTRQCMLPLFGVFVPPVARELITPGSMEYFQTTRQKWFGMPLDDYEKQKGGPEAWASIEPHLKELAGLLKENGGPYFRGKEPSYSDFVFVAFMRMFDRVGKMGGIVEADPAFGELYKACGKWLERDDH